MKFNENNFYTKLIDIVEINNFVVLSFLFEIIKMPKKINYILALKVFLTFHTRSLTPLELNLTEIA